ncbi:MAG: FecR family protein [Bacteroidia bacterium]|nr:FecR family protein [Bacteroidia bacterium]
MSTHENFKSLAKAYFEGKISLEEERQLFAFINNNDDRKEQFYEYEEDWKKQYANEDTIKAWQKVYNRMQVAESVMLPSKSQSFFSWKLLSVAAVIILLIGFSGLFFLHSSNWREKEQYEFRVAYGGQGTIILSDGTKVWLNAGSTLTYDDDFSNNRLVYLDGEAYFEVTKHKGKQFVVRSGNYELTVLGTKFNLSAYADDNLIVASLVEGAIKVACNEELRHMDPNQTLSFNKSLHKFVDQTDADVHQSFAWKDNHIEYNSILMSDLMNKLNRKFDVNIQVESEKINQEEVRVAFRNNESVDEILLALKELIPMTIARNGNNIIIN